MRFALYVALVLLTSTARADECADLPIYISKIITVSKNARFYAAVERVRSIAHMKRQYLLCELPSFFSATARSTIVPAWLRSIMGAPPGSGDMDVIIASSFLLSRLSDEEMLGFVAHEYGHLWSGYANLRIQVIKEHNKSDGRAYYEVEELADARAATWVGGDAVANMLTRLRMLNMEYLDLVEAAWRAFLGPHSDTSGFQETRALWTFETALRIGALIKK